MKRTFKRSSVPSLLPAELGPSMSAPIDEHTYRSGSVTNDNNGYLAGE
jgi:hypothetical protein